jgi:outer membrane protein
MKLKLAITGMVALTCMTAAHAQSAGSFYVMTGWLHFVPQDSSDPFILDSVGGTPINQPQFGTGVGVSDADTGGLSAGYFVTDHIATEFVMGVPPVFDLTGTGTLAPFGKLGQARQWSPTLLFKYYFRAPQATFRPYLGLGVSRVWFTGAKITNTAFEQDVLHGPTSVDTDSSWSPVFNAGFTYAITQHWFAGVSVSYLPFGTTARLTSTASTPVGNLTVRTEEKIRLDPIVTFVNIGYRF